ncbi:MAG: hypothetical protein HN909_00700 [Phycisphaerales bacterium]|jgi:penicillin-binding protein 2|nr:hypothetical protein [Phycisphaerales bacterium]MBT7170268.1 hypothetical protein [Phycisphaerales bacterium]
MFRRRLIILLGLFFVTLFALGLRAAALQLFTVEVADSQTPGAKQEMSRGDQYREEAEELMRVVRPTTGARGRILDRKGVILAEDRACYDLCIGYRFLVDEPCWVRDQHRQIAKTLGVDYDTESGQAKAEAAYAARKAKTWALLRSAGQAMDVDVDRRARRIRFCVEAIRRRVGTTVREERTSHVLVGTLTESLAQQIDLLGDIPGVVLKPSHGRYYPFGDIACHILGVTGQVTREEMTHHNYRPEELDWLERMRKNYRPGDTMGKTGVEALAEKLLRPVRGYQRFECFTKLVEEVAPQDGNDVTLTIDIELQQRLTEVFKSHNHTGALAVIDVESGDVLAMVSYPTYDLNTYRKNYAVLSRDVVRLPLIHRAVSACYAPGSTTKPVTGLSAIAAGRITPGTSLTCTGTNRHTRSGKPNCWIYRSYRSTHGPQIFEEALKHSCNIFFVEAAHRVGARHFGHWLEKFGFGQKPGTGLHEERSGMVATPERAGRAITPGDAWNMSIGQGTFSASVLHVANAHAMIARGGTFLSTKLLSEGIPQVRRELNLSAASIRAAHDGMYRVVHEHGGTAYRAFQHADLPVDICGKTGTAQTSPMLADLDGDGQREVVRSGNHSWFAGFAPRKNPTLAFAVLCEYAGSGSRNAGPVAADIVKVCTNMGYLTGGQR